MGQYGPVWASMGQYGQSVEVRAYTSNNAILQQDSKRIFKKKKILYLFLNT